MNILETYGKEIVSILAPFITWGLSRFFKAKAKLLLANPHKFTFLVPEPLIDNKGNILSPTQTVNTSTFVINNVGKETATNVELVFNWKPLCINVWPSRHVKEHTEHDKRYVLIFDSLSPGEVLGCEVLSINSQLPDLIIVRSDQCVAQLINMLPQPVPKNWFKRTIFVLIFAGIAAIVYLLIVLLQLFILKTPVGY